MEIEVVEAAEKRVETGTNVFLDDKEPDGRPKKMGPRHYFMFVEMFILSLSVMYVEMCLTPALPMMRRQWADTAEWIPWVLSIYNITGAVAMPIAGFLASIYGPRLISVIFMGGYALGTLGCALSENIWLMIVFRGVQGLGECGFTLFFAVANAVYPSKIVPVVIGILSCNFSIGMAIGLVGGAATMQIFERWQDVFWPAFALIAVMDIALYFTIEENTAFAHKAEETKKQPFDWLGTILIVFSLLAVLVPITGSSAWGWDNPVTIVLLVLGVVGLVAFVFVELKVQSPVIPFKIILTRDLMCDNIISLILGFVVFGTVQLYSYMLQSPVNSVLGEKTQLNAALVMMPFGLAELISSPLSGALGHKTGFSAIFVVALIFQVTSFVLQYFFHQTLVQALCLITLYGLSTGCLFVAAPDLISEKVSPTDFPAVSAANTVFRVIGGAVGPIICDFVTYSHTILHDPDGDGPQLGAEIPSDTGYKRCIITLLCCSATALLISFGFTDKTRLCKRMKNKKSEAIEMDKVSE